MTKTTTQFRPISYEKYDLVRQKQKETGQGASTVCMEVGTTFSTFKAIEKERGDTRILGTARQARTVGGPTISTVHLAPKERKTYTRRTNTATDSKVFVVVTTIGDLQSVLRGLS